MTSEVADPDLLNNAASEITSASPAADIAITKSDSPDPALVGEELVYTVTVANNGPSRASGVVLTDALPADVTFGSGEASQGSGCSQGAGTVTCDLGTIDNDASAVVTISVTPLEAGRWHRHHQHGHRNLRNKRSQRRQQ